MWLLFILMSRFPTLNRWIQMQTNLHRVSEFAVMSDQTTSKNVDKLESKTAIKRYREHDSDTESEVDEISVGKNIQVALPEHKDQISVASDPWHDSPKSRTAEHDSTVFLSFDWENEGPYERAVERYIFIFSVFSHHVIFIIVDHYSLYI